jgi:nicotinamide/nicotinate riboside kinase
MVSFLSKVRASGGEIPPDHHSHDHLNEQKQVPVDSGVIEKWAEEFRKIGEEREKIGEKVTWILLDGFLLYWNRVRSCRRKLQNHTVTFRTGSRRSD